MHAECMERVGGAVFRTVVGVLLVAVCTAADLAVAAVHGALIALVLGCVAAVAGLTAYVNSVKGTRAYGD